MHLKADTAMNNQHFLNCMLKLVGTGMHCLALRVLIAALLCVYVCMCWCTLLSVGLMLAFKHQNSLVAIHAAWKPTRGCTSGIFVWRIEISLFPTGFVPVPYANDKAILTSATCCFAATWL